MSSSIDVRILAYRHLNAAGGILQATASRGLAKDRLTITQFRALNLLRVRGPLPQKEVAKYIWRSVSNVGVLAIRLKRAGLIEVQGDENDGRVVMMSLTERGRELLARVVPEHITEIRQAMSNLTEAECETLLRLIDKLSPEE